MNPSQVIQLYNTLKEKNLALQQVISQLNINLNKKDAIINELNASIEKKDNIISILKTSNESKDTEISRLKQENTELINYDDKKTIQHLKENNINFKKSGPFILMS